jgi:hypothetical protein
MNASAHRVWIPTLMRPSEGLIPPLSVKILDVAGPGSRERSEDLVELAASPPETWTRSCSAQRYGSDSGREMIWALGEGTARGNDPREGALAFIPEDRCLASAGEAGCHLSVGAPVAYGSLCAFASSRLCVFPPLRFSFFFPLYRAAPALSGCRGSCPRNTCTIERSRKGGRMKRGLLTPSNGRPDRHRGRLRRHAGDRHR